MTVDDETGGPALTRAQAAVLTAYVELIEELGTDDISYRLIARRSGVSERTVFRSYPTRVELLRATAAWVQPRAFGHSPSASVFDLPLEVRDAMRDYDVRPPLAHVVAEAAVRDEDVPRNDQVVHVDRLVRDDLPHLAHRERESLVAALTQISSASAWVVLRQEFGMDARDAADAAAWAGEALLQPVRASGQDER